MTGPDLKRLPLEDLHIAASARFGPFAGWSMPITYPAGVMKEHLHAREHAGLFDISHMRLLECRARRRRPHRQGTRSCGGLAISQSKYTFFLNEQAASSTTSSSRGSATSAS